MDEREEVTREKRIALLKSMLKAAYKDHRSFIVEHTEKSGISYDTAVAAMLTVKKALKSARAARRDVYIRPFKERTISRIAALLTDVLKKISKNKYANVVCGTQIEAYKSKSSRHAVVFSVGYRWEEHVFLPLYTNVSTDYGDRIILSADKMRINEKWVELYEVKTFSVSKNMVETMYVGRTKTTNRRCCMARTIKAAVEATKRMVDEEIDKALIGEAK